MPIYDQGYQRWNGELQRHPVRWWPILRRGFIDVIRQRKYLLLLVLAWMPPLVRAVQLFFSSRSRISSVIESDFFGTGMGFFFGVLTAQGFFVMLFVVFVGSDLIARDRRHNALQIYFSKPLTTNDYILGKLGIVGSFVTAVTWVPLLLLWLFALAVNPKAGYFGEIWSVPLVATAYCIVLIAVAGLLVLTLSAIARRAIFIAVSWLILFGWGPMGYPIWILRELSGREYWGLIGIAGNVEQVGAWWFGADRPYDFSPFASLTVLVAVVAVCYVVLRRRIKPVEVVL